jgi:hypothetical protein
VKTTAAETLGPKGNGALFKKTTADARSCNGVGPGKERSVKILYICGNL